MKKSQDIHFHMRPKSNSSTGTPTSWICFAFNSCKDSYLCRLCTIRVKAAMGVRPLGFLESCSTSCHDVCPSREDSSLHVFSREYKSLSLKPVDQDQKTFGQPDSLLKSRLLLTGRQRISACKTEFQMLPLDCPNNFGDENFVTVHQDTRTEAGDKLISL